MDQLRTTFHLLPDPEVTLEMDPGTFTYERLVALQSGSSGINRISMGVQSFDNDLLKRCSRPHTTEDTTAALEALHKA